MTTRKAYTTDLSELEWQLIEPLIPGPKRLGRKIAYSRREILNAISISTETVALGEICPGTSRPMVSFRTTITQGFAVGCGKLSMMCSEHSSA